MQNKVLVVDIDGTICTTEGSDYPNSQPIHQRISSLNLLSDEGYIIIFLTARGMGSSNNNAAQAEAKWRKLTEDQLVKWGVKYQQLFFGKPAGDAYIDDKGINDEDFFSQKMV
jgi:dTDP-glucose 4,6-dehydratase